MPPLHVGTDEAGTYLGPKDGGGGGGEGGDWAWNGRLRVGGGVQQSAVLLSVCCTH